MRKLVLLLLIGSTIGLVGCGSDDASTAPVGDTTPGATGGPKTPGPAGAGGGGPSAAPEAAPPIGGK